MSGYIKVPGRSKPGLQPGSGAGQDAVVIQATAVGVTLVWSGVVAFVCYKIVDIFVGLRVPEDEEREGLDITSHGESAYHN